ncbi:hypothetical protein [Pantoea agglomerans]|uniref:hypothetical protein n=1 Tax=Enterobacter agglomerans TaxID=549 RepID=UPI00320BA240
MEMNLTTLGNIFSATYSRVAINCQISGEAMTFRSENMNSLLSCRAMMIFKLDLLLFKFRNEIDPGRLFLRGKNSLECYLLKKKGIHDLNYGNYSLPEVLAVLSDDLDALVNCAEMDQFHSHLDDVYKDQYNLNVTFKPCYSLKYPPLDWADWDCDWWDTMLLK